MAGFGRPLTLYHNNGDGTFSDLIRWSKKVENYIALLHMAFSFITYRQMGLFG